MLQAQGNFRHIIEETHRAEHTLLTTGMYRYLRHPSYFGWFWYVILSQIALGNPVCTFAFAVAAIAFFRDRIAFEESILLQEDFFGSAYQQYRRRTYIGIPFV